MDDKRKFVKKFQVVSNVCDPKQVRNHAIASKFSKFCLTSQEKTGSQTSDMNVLRDKDVQDKVKQRDDNTFCSELENTPPPTMIKKPPCDDGSESLFSTQSSDKMSEKVEGQLSQDVSEMHLGEVFTQEGGEMHEPLLLESSPSLLDTTLSKDSSFMEHYNKNVRHKYSNETLDSYREKAQDGESPEKSLSTLDDTEDKTVLGSPERERSELEETVDNTCEPEELEVLSISSGAGVSNESEESEESVICVSDSEDDQDCTRSSSQLGHVVSSIVDSLNATTSSQLDKFFDNVPLLGTPERNLYTKSFDPRRTKDNDERPAPCSLIEEIIPESDPEPDSQQTNSRSPPPNIASSPPPNVNSSPKTTPKVQPVSSCSSSNSDTVTQINISANVQISIKINQSNGKTTETHVRSHNVNTGTKRKDPPSTTKKKPKSPEPGPSRPRKPESPQPGPSRPKHTNRSFRTPLSQKPQKESAKDLKNTQNEKVQAIEVDEVTSQYLDEIYGKDKWQTPQLKTKTAKRTNKDKSLLDFSSFNRNLCSKLESTRLPNQQTPINPTKRTLDLDERPKPSPCRSKAVTPMTSMKTPRPPTLAICDSDTPSENESPSDESWRAEESSIESSDSEDTKAKKRQVKTTKKQREIRPPRYSSSDEDIAQGCTDKPSQVKSPLSNVLDSCEYKQKDKLPATPAPGKKTKRKLFNPNKTCEEVELEEVPVRNKSNMDHDISQIQDDALSFRLDLPLLPKAVERLLDKEPKKTPSRKTPATKTNKNLFATPIDVAKLGFLQSLDVNTPEYLCDPEALRFRQNYKNLKVELTEKLFVFYNECIFENELVAPCSWNKKLLNTAGRCHLTRVGGVRKARIELSEKVLTSADRLRCTLIHEMCHAATWIYNGEDGHGKTWKAWAHKANTVLKELPKINTCHSYEIFYKYTYMCKLCKAKSQAHSRSKKVENIRCKVCHGAIEILLNKMNKEGQVVSTPVKSATGFAKFVKENYSKVKRPNVGHAEVMKILGEDFGKLTVSQKAVFN